MDVLYPVESNAFPFTTLKILPEESLNDIKHVYIDLQPKAQMVLEVEQFGTPWDEFVLHKIQMMSARCERMGTFPSYFSKIQLCIIPTF